MNGSCGNSTTRVVHLRVSLALHHLNDVDGPPLLLLHGLAEQSPRRVPVYARRWPGRVVALDFTGHGESDIPAGGGYTSEALVGDVDAALAQLGPATLVGRGLGAYVAVLTAGARPELVRGAILADGPGLAGGGPTPTSLTVLPSLPRPPATPDPYALAELAREVRPPELAAVFAAAAVRLRPAPHDVIVSATASPPWLAAVAAVPGVRRLALAVAVDDMASTSVGTPS